MGFEIPRGLTYKWQNSQTQLMELLNCNLTNKILPPTPEPYDDSSEETPIKITSTISDKGWWEDCSPLQFLDDISTGKLDINKISEQIDSLIDRTLTFNDQSSVQLSYADYMIDIRKALKTTI